MTQQNPNHCTAARAARDTGMQLALDHAESVHDGWAEQAIGALQIYLSAHPGKTFMTEDVRAYAYDVLAIPHPPHCRAWGGVIARAAREGLIKRVGVGPVKTASSHMANASVWRGA